VFDFGVDQENDGLRISIPMSCMQCDEPPCLDVCPSKATYVRPDGIVGIDTDLCIGCGYCIVGCPYNTRSIIEDDTSVPGGDMVEKNGLKSFLGTCTKCDFCADKVDAGIEQGLIPGLDSDASPSCVNMCTANALHFGDLEDPESKVSKLIESENVECLHPEIGTNPSLYYIIPEGYTLTKNKK